MTRTRTRTQAREPAYEWRGGFENDEVEALHAEGFGHGPVEYDWRARVERHSVGWVCARQADGARRLVGFVNVAWDGGAHAFVLDTVVAATERRRGVGVRLVTEAERGARAAGCEWLHVDFEPHLRRYYFDACGFTPTDAGLIRLRG
jgi:GNAT superfamily N-acetyltransferase